MPLALNEADSKTVYLRHDSLKLPFEWCILILFSNSGKHPSHSVKMGITGYHILGIKNGSDSHGITFWSQSFLCVIEVAQGTFEVFFKFSNVPVTDPLSASFKHK